MDEENEKNTNVSLNIWEIKNIRYYLYQTIIKDNMYTDNYINFSKNLFKKFNIAIEELEPSNMGIHSSGNKE